eukprot:5964637-Alexandrium_andersonii.AAC.1
MGGERLVTHDWCQVGRVGARSTSIGWNCTSSHVQIELDVCGYCGQSEQCAHPAWLGAIPPPQKGAAH